MSDEGTRKVGIMKGEQALDWKLNPSSITYWLCDLGTGLHSFKSMNTCYVSGTLLSIESIMVL